VRQSDPHLAAMSGVFGRLPSGQQHARPGAGRPGACQPQPPPASRRLERGGADHPGRGNQRPAQQDCRRGHRFRCAGARRRSPRITTQVRNRGAPGSCASGDDRSCCRGRSESPAHRGGITISSSFLGQLLVVRRLLRGEYVAAARRDSRLQRYRVRVRGHLGEIPGPAAPSPDGATLCRPRKLPAEVGGAVPAAGRRASPGRAARPGFPETRRAGRGTASGKSPDRSTPCHSAPREAWGNDHL